jgi:predicted SnoaL-like aldol condensation-catalyzing enzyme
MTRSVPIHEFGGSEALRTGDVVVGEPGAGEVRLRIHAIGMLLAGIAASLMGISMPATAHDSEEHHSEEHRIEQVRTFLKGFPNNSADQVTAFIDAAYIEHAPGLSDGQAGQRAYLAGVPKDSSIKPVRIFADGDYVVVQSEYNLSGPKVVFDVYRFHGDKVVEHWNNVQDKCSAPNVSGRTQIDGPTAVRDLDRSQANKDIVQAYFDAVVFEGKRDQMPVYRYVEDFHQHNCTAGDIKGGVPAKGTTPAFKIEKVHKILGRGNFVLVMSQGVYDSRPSAFFDLYRLQDSKQVEHWDVIEDLPAARTSRNQKGKF